MTLRASTRGRLLWPQRRLRSKASAGSRPHSFGRGQHAEIFTDHGREPSEEGARDDGVTDRHFVEKWQAAKYREVRQVEIVPGVDAESERMRQTRSTGKHRERPARRFWAAFERSGIRLGVELDAIGADGRGPLDGIGRRVDEQADANAARAQLLDDVGDPLPRRARLPAGLAGHLSRNYRHERALI